MTSAKLTAALLLALYLGAGLCFAIPEAAPTPQPWGAPTPEARWTKIIQRDDPRPFWVRLLLSIRYDFYHKDIRGGAEF